MSQGRVSRVPSEAGVIPTMNKVIHNMGIVWRLGTVCAACALLAMPAYGQGQDSQGVEINEADLVSITVQDTDLAKVLQMLSIQSKKNIVTSAAVSGTVTANLYDVTFYEALDSILRANNYRYIEDGNFIYVYTKAEYEELMASMRKTESRIYTLEYLSALDANEFITPLLSEDGQAAFRGDVQPGIEPDLADVGADSYAFDAKLVVNDYPDVLDNIASLLEDLDTPPQQVLVEATVLSATLTENNAFGVDFSVIGSIDFTDLTAPLNPISNILNGNDANTGFQPPDNEGYGLQSTPGNTGGPGTFKIGVVHNDISAFLNLLDTVTDTTVLARPKILALNRQRAEVLVGARVGYLSTTATQTTTTQTVEFLDTGIQLNFRPFISKSGMVRLELSPSISEAQLRDVNDANGQVITIPDEITNQIVTNVRVRDGETVILGGLFKESITSGRRQVPGLGDVPIIGAAFRGHDDTLERDEIIFLITPTIVEDERLFEIGQNLDDYTYDTLVGAREGMLPFSRDKQTESYNREAIAAFAEGDAEAALYHVNNSLRLNSNQPHMRKFRERVTGQNEDLHERSMLERVMEREFGELEAHFDSSSEPDEIVRVLRERMAEHVASTPASSESTTEPIAMPEIVMEEDVYGAGSTASGNSESVGAGQQFAGTDAASMPIEIDPYQFYTADDMAFIQSLTAEERHEYERFLQNFYNALGLPGYETDWIYGWSYIDGHASSDEVPLTSPEESVDLAEADSDFPD